MACWIPSPWARPKWAKDRDAAAAVQCPVKEPEPVCPMPEPKPKRTRRTKAEILAAD